MADSTTNLDLIATSQAQKEVTANDLFDAGSPATALGRRATTTLGLTWGYYGGVVALGDGSLLQVANGTKTLTNTATNYVELDTSDGSVDVNTSGWTGSGKKRLYKIVVAGGLVTSFEDWRTTSITPSGGVSDGDKGDITVASSGTSWTIDADAVTYAKMQNVSATDKLLGRSTAGSGNVEEITCTAAGRALLDDADSAAQRTTLGLGTSATLASDTDVTLAANSDARLATQKAVKAYIDGVVTGGAAGVMIFKGTIDCSANPNYPAANAGDVYKVSVAGKIGGGSGPNVEVGDTLYCTTTAVSGNHATVGSSWNIVQENIDGAVIGPASATNGHLAVFDGTTGKLIADGGAAPTGTNTGDETATTLGTTFHGAANKATPVDADEMPILDSVASFIGKHVTWANIKATLKTYFDTLYATVSQPFDLTAFYPGVPTASAIVTRVPVARAVTFPDDFAGSYGVASAAATASTAFDVKKNGSSVGTITFALGQTTATFVTSGTTVVMAAGDVLQIVAPGTPDATLADVGFVLAGTR